MEKLIINGNVLTYDHRGKGTPLLLLHGFPLDHSIWKDLAPLLESHFEMIIPNLRGMGDSDLVDGAYTLTDMASDLVTLLNFHKFETAVVAGHSMGGYLALAFTKAHRDRVKALGLISTQALADNQERKDGRYATAQQVMQEGVGFLAKSMTEKLTSNSDIQNFCHGVISRQKPGGVAGCLRAMAEREDTAAVVGEFTGPLAIFHGAADALVHVDRAREMHASNQKSIYVEDPNGGHMPMIENPQALADLLRKLA